MNCNQCHIQYSTKKPNIPRVLINCGHTLCQTCIQKTFKDQKLKCPECEEVSYGISFHQYPINATLLQLLQGREQDMCRVHNKKLEGYCEKDNQLLCIHCIINGVHKNHKIASIVDKVNKDKEILKECMRQIQDNHVQIENVINTSNQSFQSINNEYKDYLLELGLCFTNLHDLLKELQKQCQQKVKNHYENIKQKYTVFSSEIQERKKFMLELQNIYNYLISLSDIQYLNQDNKRIFILENCKYKKNKVDLPKIVFNKLSVLNQVTQALQQAVNYEKKLQSQGQGQSQGQTQGQTTPVLKPKKSNRGKQPTVLEVNLSEQYKKHFKSTIELPAQSSLQTGNGLHSKHRNQKLNNSKQGGGNNYAQDSRTPKQEKNPPSEKKVAISLAGSSQSQKNNNSFHSECLPISMINSFMESSNQSLSIRGSEADFTLLSYDQKIYHFGGFNDSSMQYGKIQDPKSSKQINVNIERSKAQCAIIPSYSPHKCLIFGGKSSTDQKLETFLQFDLHTNKVVTNLFKLSQAKSGFGSTIKQNRLYISGGSNSQRSLRSFQEYRITPNSMVKTDLTNMNHCRDQLGMTLGFDGKIYACGGINQSGSVLASCERYNQGKAKWEIVASMNRPRRSFALVSLPHGIYAIGGYDGNQYLKDVQLYDFTQQKWIIVSSMNQPRFAHTALVTADLQSIIVSGGFHKKPLKSTQIFDIIHEKWVQGAPLQTERFLHCSLISNF